MKRSNVWSVLAMVGVGLAVTAARGNTLELNPSADAGLSQQGGGTAYGLNNYLSSWADFGANDQEWGLLKFDLTSITPASTVTSATLTLTIANPFTLGTTHNSASSPDGDYAYLHLMTHDWSEATVSYNDVSGSNYSTWVNSGVTIQGSPLSGLPTTVTFDVTSLIAAWRSDAASNFGVFLGGASGNRWGYFSRESSTGKPVLSLTGSISQVPEAGTLSLLVLGALLAARRTRKA